MRVIICGSRTYNNQLTVEDVHEAIKKSKFKIKEVVTGEKFNEDVLAYAYAEFKSLPIKEFPVNWDDISNCKVPKTNRYGKQYNPSAGFERNAKMVEYADAIIAFWDENSAAHGTEHIINQAKKVGKPIHYAKPNPEFIF